MKYMSILIFFVSVLAANSNYDIEIQLKPNDDIVNAINTIVNRYKNKSIKVILEKGTYLLSSSSHDTHLISLKDIHNFSFDGNGSLLLIKNESKGFMSFRNSHNINISNMRIDYSVLPKSLGKVISINYKKKEIIFEVSQSDAISLHKNLLNTTKRKTYALSFYKPGLIKDTRVTFLKNITHLKNRKYILKYKQLHSIETNDTLVLIFRYPRPVFKMNKSAFIHFNNITVYAAPSGVFIGRETSKAIFKNCKVLLKKGRFVSSNADVFHFQSSRLGPVIQNCTVEGVGDDIVSLHSVPMKVIKVKGRKSLFVKKKKFMIKKSDYISFFNREKGTIPLISKVVKIIKYKKNYLVQFENEIPLNIGYQNLSLYDRNCSNQGFVIKNSIFRKSRRYGCYIKAFNGVIDHNTFSELGSSAIAIKNEPKWPEGLNSENILIKNNSMSNCGTNYPKNTPLINIRFLSLHGLSHFIAHKNIRIINNKMNNKQMFSIQNVSNLKLQQ